MMNVGQFRREIIRPTLKVLDLHSKAAENLLVGTALVESKLTYLRQLRGGPAVSVYQIEPTTHSDIWSSFLDYRPDLAKRVQVFRSGIADPTEDLLGNLPYATAIARLVYYRKPEPLPVHYNIMGLAKYWKRYYNTNLGKGDPIKFVQLYETYAR